jgi:hypothetical protein
MSDIELSTWPEIACSGGLGKQKMTLHRHDDGRLMVVGSVVVDGERAAAKRTIGSDADVESAMRRVAADLALDDFIVVTCLASFKRWHANDGA